MTAHKNTNLNPEQSNHNDKNSTHSQDMLNSSSQSEVNNAKDESTDWEKFANDHSEELESLRKTRVGKKFERAAEKEESSTRKTKYRMESFKPNLFSSPKKATDTPPRAYATSWLDTEDVLNANDTFNIPDIGNGSVTKSMIIFSLMILLALLGLILGIVFPQFSSYFFTASGVLLVIGLMGLKHQFHNLRQGSSSDKYGAQL